MPTSEIENILKKLHKYKGAFLKIVGSFVIIIALQYLINRFLQTPTGELFFEEHIVLASIFIILYTTITHIFAPFFAAPVAYASLTIFGVWQTSLYMYISGLISGAIGFWIARKYGRKIVIDLVGEDAMKDVDYFVHHSGAGILTISRIVGFSLFELITYAFGLTSMSFKKFYLITVFASIIPNVLIPIIFQQFNFHRFETLAIFMVILGLIESVYILIIRYQWKSKK